MIKLTIGEITVELRDKIINDEQMYNLKDIEKAWKEQGGKGKRLDHWKESSVFNELSKLPEFRVVYLTR